MAVFTVPFYVLCLCHLEFLVLMTAQLDEEDTQEEHETNGIGHEARLDEQEAADDEDDALGQIAGVGEVTDKR